MRTGYHSPALFYHACPASLCGIVDTTSGGVPFAGPLDRSSQASTAYRPIPTAAGILGTIGMPAFSCAYGQNRQNVLSAGRAGGSARFYENPDGVLTFSSTPAAAVMSRVPVPPSHAALPVGTPRSEHRGGVFSSESPDGVFIVPAPGLGPIEGLQLRAERAVGAPLFSRPRRFSNAPRRAAVHPGKRESHRALAFGEPAARRRAFVAPSNDTGLHIRFHFQAPHGAVCTK